MQNDGELKRDRNLGLAKPVAHVLLVPDVYRALRDIADHSGQTPSELMAALLTKAAGEARD